MKILCYCDCPPNRFTAILVWLPKKIKMEAVKPGEYDCCIPRLPDRTVKRQTNKQVMHSWQDYLSHCCAAWSQFCQIHLLLKLTLMSSICYSKLKESKLQIVLSWGTYTHIWHQITFSYCSEQNSASLCVWLLLAKPNTPPYGAPSHHCFKLQLFLVSTNLNYSPASSFINNKGSLINWMYLT